MSNAFKDLYNPVFYTHLSTAIALSIPIFDVKKFTQSIFCAEFDGYELKQRMTHTAKVLHLFLPQDFASAIALIKSIIGNLRLAGIKEESVEFMFFPEYIALYGIDDYDNSIEAFEFITEYTSCEFAVRPYIIKYQQKMIDQMMLWAKHPHHMVRRLATEGSRPRLPWAMALPELKADPTAILVILHQLMNDSHEIVRRSVANNLNDISKDNPDIVLAFSTQYKGINKTADATTKHACRTLLKQGNVQALKLFGFDSRNIELTDFQIETPLVNIGNQLIFSFSILNNNDEDKMVRLEYGLYYKKSNGDLSRKVFKISERALEPNKNYEVLRKQSFRPITTRKFYIGVHQLSIIINGQEKALKEFELMH
jgi:3-methyladenine DNA glycosylase AlkC